jgi:predicted nucleic acid-binding Zn ribbon protein
MPHLKCVPCKIRFQYDDRLASDVRKNHCPVCDSPLEPAAGLAELVGFQRSRLDGVMPVDNRDFLAAVAMALNPPTVER